MPGHATTESPCGLASLLLIGLLLGSTAGCSETEGIAAPPRSTAETFRARVIEVAEREWPREVATQGNLVADETAVVGAKVAGRIEEVAVDLGDYVEAGTVLASLDRREFEERVRQAEAELAQGAPAVGIDRYETDIELDVHASPIVVEQKALWDQARSDRDRAFALRGREVASDAEYVAAVTAEQAARARHASAINSVHEMIALARVRTAQLELEKRELEDAVIRAPFDGRIQDRHVSPGTYVQLGDRVVTLIRDDPLRYRGTVPEPYAPSLELGQRVRLRVETGPELPELTITRISPAIDPFSRSLLFEALLPNPGHAIQAGQFAQGEVVLDQSRRAIAVPRSAIVEFAGTQKVWKVVDGRAVEQPIEMGVKRGDLVEIVRGLEPGDRVLLDGSEGRSAKVEIQELVAALPAVAGGVSAPLSTP